MKFNLKNTDGTFNGKLIAGVILLGIVLVQQVLTVLGYSFPGSWASIVAVINTVLTILGMLGVVTDVTPVTETDVQATSTTPVATTADTAKDTQAVQENTVEASTQVVTDDATPDETSSTADVQNK